MVNKSGNRGRIKLLNMVEAACWVEGDGFALMR